MIEGYKATDFRPSGLVTLDVIDYIIDAVPWFKTRYYLALCTMDELRCGLRNSV